MLLFLTTPTPLDPVAFTIFGAEVRWYAICILLGVLAAALIGYYGFGKRLGANADLVLEAVSYGVLFGVIGARLYYVLFEHSNINSLIDVINPKLGGLAIHGAIYATAIYVVVYCRIKKIKLLAIIEIVVPVFLLAQAIGRWGNFFNQEAFGPIVNGYTTGPLSIDQLQAQREALKSYLVPNFVINQMYITNFRGLNIPNIVGYYHPTFYYEMIFNLVGVGLMMIPRRFYKKLYLGDALAIYLFWYGITRYFIESLRTDPLMIGSIRIAQLTSAIYIVIGLLLFILRRVFKYKLESSYEYFYQEGNSLFYDKPTIAENEELETSENLDDKRNDE